MTRLAPRTLLVATAAVLAGTGAVGLGATTGGDPVVEAQAAVTPSSFVPIDAYRAVDTRRAAGRPNTGRLVVSETITVTADEDVDGNQMIPDAATAVTFNITAVDTVGKGFLQVTTGTRELGNTSTVNWTTDGENVANSGVTAVFESETDVNAVLENTFAVFIDGDEGSSAHVVVDITGYYVPSG